MLVGYVCLLNECMPSFPAHGVVYWCVLWCDVSWQCMDSKIPCSGVKDVALALQYLLDQGFTLPTTIAALQPMTYNVVVKEGSKDTVMSTPSESRTIIKIKIVQSGTKSGGYLARQFGADREKSFVTYHPIPSR